jgi:hypothetical protein
MGNRRRLRYVGNYFLEMALEAHEGFRRGKDGALPAVAFWDIELPIPLTRWQNVENETELPVTQV